LSTRPEVEAVVAGGDGLRAVRLRGRPVTPEHVLKYDASSNTQTPILLHISLVAREVESRLGAGGLLI